MEGHVSWIVECSIKEGQLGTFEELMQEMIEGTSTESETLAYEWYISEDESKVHIFEKYASSEATVAHVTGFLEKWARRFSGAIDMTGFVVYGDPSHEAREILDGWGATYMAPWGGFSRFSS